MKTKRSDDRNDGGAARTVHPRKTGGYRAATEAVSTGALPRLTYRIAECSAALGISRWQVDKLIRTGELATVDLAGVVAIPAEELNRFIAQGTVRRRSSAS